MTEDVEYLTTMLEWQEKFDSDLKKRRTLDYSDIGDWGSKLCTAMQQEISELRDEFPWKWWKNAKPINRENVLEEMIDILHFWLSMANKMGFTADDIWYAYQIKNKKNFRRQREVKGYAIKTLKDWDMHGTSE